MTLLDTTPPGQTDSIAFEFELTHPPQKVWRALTEPALLSEWLLPTLGFHLEAGAEFTLQAPPQPGWDGVVRCQLLEVDAPRMIRYAWRVPPLDTVVTFTLTPTASGTRLSLIQSGFKPDQTRNSGGARYGWRLMGARLEPLLGSLP